MSKNKEELATTFFAAGAAATTMGVLLFLVELCIYQWPNVGTSFLVLLIGVSMMITGKIKQVEKNER